MFQIRLMTWNRIRLDLARTTDFPQGSADIAYLLDLPLGEDSRLDEKQLRAEPERARVLRSLPDAPDLVGYLVRASDGWAFSYAPGERDDESVFHLETHAIRPGEYLTLTESDGRRLPLRVTSVQALG